jgi:TRAP-type C4-dicarboxylate transport system substrate-binding protein
MKLSRHLKRIAVLAGFVAASLGAVNASAQEITLKAISAWPVDNFFSLNFGKFVAKVNAEGKGLVQINYLGGGPKVMPPFEVANAAKTGVADMVNVAGGFYTTLLPEADAMSLGNLSASELRKNGAHDYINKLWGEKLNVRYLGRSVDSVPINVFLRKPITKPDLTGFRMRVIPLYRPFMESVNTQSNLSIPPGEVYTALERGLLDGYVWPIIGLYDVGIEKQTKYRVEPGFYNVETGVMINLDVWKKMTEPQRAFLEKTALWMEELNLAHPKLVEEERKRHAASGIETITFTGKDAQEWLTKANESVWATLIKRSPEHGPKLRTLMTK